MDIIEKIKTKICSKCGEEKDINEFRKNKYNKNDGYRLECKDCSKKYLRENYEKNKELKKIVIETKICSKCEIEKEINQFFKDKYKRSGYRSICKECSRLYCLENEESRKKWHKEHKVERNIRERKRKINDPVYKLRCNVSCSIRGYLKRFNSSKKDSCLKHLPYTIQQLYDHLEKQFDPNMSWSNYGSYWDIDHIIPQSKLPYDSMEHPNFQKCWALSNLRPLEHIENIRKGNKLIS